MSSGTHHHIRGFDADDQVVIAQLFDDPHLVKSALHKSLRRNAMIFFHQLLLQRTAVDAHPDGDPPFPGRVHHRTDPFRAPDVSRIDTDLVRSVLHGGDGHLIVKMNIRHQRNMDLFFDFLQSQRRFHGRHRTPDDLAPRLLQSQDLGRCSLRVLRPRVRHGLNQHRIAASDDPVPDFHCPCMLSVHARPPD